MDGYETGLLREGRGIPNHGVLETPSPPGGFLQNGESRAPQGWIDGENPHGFRVQEVSSLHPGAEGESSPALTGLTFTGINARLGA